MDLCSLSFALCDGTMSGSSCTCPLCFLFSFVGKGNILYAALQVATQCFPSIPAEKSNLFLELFLKLHRVLRVEVTCYQVTEQLVRVLHVFG